jgi:hypothetical protein
MSIAVDSVSILNKWKPVGYYDYVPFQVKLSLLQTHY